MPGLAPGSFTPVSPFSMQDPRMARHSRRFLRLATAFEGGLLLVAFALGWLLSVDPSAYWKPDLSSLAWGLLGTVPLYLLFFVGYRKAKGGMKDIRELLIERLGPFLSACSAAELLYLGMLAGVAEEVLFRGVLQPWFEGDWGWIGGIVISNLIFALAHWVTPLYGLLAGLTGAYLGVSLDITGERNLVVPVLIHGIYDFLAFSAVAETYRREAAAGRPAD